MHRALILAALCATPITATASLPGLAPRADKGEPATIETSDDLELAGTYWASRGKSRAPGVLLIHDAGADRTQLEGIAESLQKKGFAVLTVDLRGHGESKAKGLDWEECDEEKRSELWQRAPRDVEAAADWLLSQRDVHSTSLSLVGYRSGCALAARHAERDENVVSLALLSPKPMDLGFDVEKDIQRVNGLPTFVMDQPNDETKRMVTEANAITSRPYISLVTVTRKRDTVLDDSKTPSKVSAWLAEIALPRKGRG